MKIQIGKREKVNPELKTGMAMVEIHTQGKMKPTVLDFDEVCDKCGARIKITVSEEVSTGIIWLEGPDKCEKCGHQISSNTPTFEPLNQGQIEEWFGKV